MLFNTLDFALFFAVVYGVLLLLRHRAQNVWLLLASYTFYAAWNWRFLGLILASTAVDYLVARRLGATEDERRRRRLVTISLVFNLGLLAVFKYAGFFAQSLVELAASVGVELAPWTVQVGLPVGISFYTFQTLSYTLDVYRRQLQPVASPTSFALYVAFFPQLVAGPIERARRLIPQIVKPRTITWERIGSGGWLILSGLFRKVVVADNLGSIVDVLYSDPSAATGLEVLVGTYAFAWQIYCDFSGYSAMARGTARLMGFELMVNFNLPYLAVDPADFWRRWHISLSTWLRDYLYIPLGGNRHGRWLTLRNLGLTMLLGGLWHGAAWTFVVWGAYQGALLIGHRLLREAWRRARPQEGAVALAGSGAGAEAEGDTHIDPGSDGAATRGIGAAAWWSLRVVVMFHLACLGWLIFRAESMGDVLLLLGRFGDLSQVGRVADWWLPLVALTAPLLTFQLVQRARGLECVLRWPVPVRAALYVVVVYAIVLLGEDFGAPFLYFQF